MAEGSLRSRLTPARPGERPRVRRRFPLSVFVGAAVLLRYPLESVERDLLARARLGDAEAFHALLLPRHGSLRRLAFSFTGNWDEADDLAQEAMVKAFRVLPTFEQRSAFSTWLYAVARSVCRDFHRRKSADRVQSSEPDDQAACGSLQDQLLENHELSQILWLAIQRLEPEFRATLVLSDVEGLSYQEIAEIEALPVGTVRSRLSRARARLRRMLTVAHPSLLPLGRSALGGRSSSSPGTVP